MSHRSITGVVALAALCLASTGTAANDAAKYPDWKGQWYRIGNGNHDGNKPRGLGQQAPLTPEYQAILDAIQGLTPEDLAVAWDYYASHPEEIGEAIRLNEEA